MIPLHHICNYANGGSTELVIHSCQIAICHFILFNQPINDTLNDNDMIPLCHML